MSPFVYTGAGARGSPHLTVAQSFCVKEACCIQKCLARNGSSEDKCLEAIEFWRGCVGRHEARLARDAEGKGKGKEEG